MRLKFALSALFAIAPFCVGQELSEKALKDSGLTKRAPQEIPLQMAADGILTENEFSTGLQQMFKKADKDDNGILTSLEAPFSSRLPGADSNRDGVLTTKEILGFQRQRFARLNLPKGTALADKKPELHTAAVKDGVLHFNVGKAKVRMSQELAQQREIVGLVRSFDIEGVGEIFNLPLFDIGRQVVILPSEVLDLNCGTIDWTRYVDKKMVGRGSQFTIDTDQLSGRTEYVLRAGGKVVAMVAIIGSNLEMNPLYFGEAKAFLSIDDGLLFVKIRPPLKGTGGTKFRVFVAPIDESQKGTARFMLGSMAPAQRLATM